MSESSEVAEQVVRLSIEGVEMAVKITGTAAKDVAELLTTALMQGKNQSYKTHGRARLSSQLKSGKELKVFSVPYANLKTFKEHAKDYGILYCVLKDKTTKDPNSLVDIIARSEDASKIQRIFDHYDLKTVKKTKDKVDVKEERARNEEKTHGEHIVDDIMGDNQNPTFTRMEKGPLSVQKSDKGNTQNDVSERKSVRERLKRYLDIHYETSPDNVVTPKRQKNKTKEI